MKGIFNWIKMRAHIYIEKLSIITLNTLLRVFNISVFHLYFRLISLQYGKWGICLKTATSSWQPVEPEICIYGNSKSFLWDNIFNIWRKLHYYSHCAIFDWCFYCHSEYPAQRTKKGADDVDMGVAGSVNLLQNVTLSTQPISSLDWSPDKQGLCVCSSFDQSVRVLIVTKLNTVWLNISAVILKQTGMSDGCLHATCIS